MFSTASGKTYAVLAQAPFFNPSQPGFKQGGLTHLDEYQAYEKQSKHASLRVTLSKAVLDAIDANHGLLPSECPPGLAHSPDAKSTPRRGGSLDTFRAGCVPFSSPELPGNEH